MKSILAAALAVLMSGCVSSATPPKPATPASGPNMPVTLSESERATVEAGTRASLQGASASATFRTMTATKAPDGVVTACGYVDAGNGDKPYIGILTSAGFTVTGMGGADADTIVVQAACSRLGIHI